MDSQAADRLPGSHKRQQTRDRKSGLGQAEGSMLQVCRMKDLKQRSQSYKYAGWRTSSRGVNPTSMPDEGPQAEESILQVCQMKDLKQRSRSYKYAGWRKLSRGVNPTSMPAEGSQKTNHQTCKWTDRHLPTKDVAIPKIGTKLVNGLTDILS